MGWNWRAFIPRRERYDIDGREVVIVNKTSTDFSRLRDVILLVCKTERMAQHFPKIMFVIKSDSSNPCVDQLKLLKGKTVIKIGAKIVDQKESSFRQKWIGVVIHELTHLYHNYRSGILNTYSKLSDRLKYALSLKATSFQLVNFSSMRGILFGLSRLVFIEGVAKYVEYHQEFKTKEILFSETLFDRLYEHVSSQANKKNEEFLRTLELLKKRNLKQSTVDQCLSIFDGFFHSLSYSAGYHMVYTILFVDHNITFEDILHFQPFEFIRKYEECMAIKGLQPVISVTSGKGVLDYKKMLAQLTAAAKEVQKKSS